MNPCKISPTYTAVRFGLNGLFEEIESLDQDISPLIDIGETVRIMLADYFYNDYIKPIGNNIQISDRTIVFKQGVQRSDVKRHPHALATVDLVAQKFWNLSDYIYNNVLRATAEYTHPPSECFYQYSADDKAINVYLPVREGLPVITGHLPAAAVIHSCLSTLPSFLRTLIVDLMPVLNDPAYAHQSKTAGDALVQGMMPHQGGTLSTGKF